MWSDHPYLQCIAIRSSPPQAQLYKVCTRNVTTLMGMKASNQLRQEVLRLYREILRTARVFRGQRDANRADMCETVSASARRELHAARHITSSEDILRRIVTARAALHDVQQKVRFRLPSASPSASRTHPAPPPHTVQRDSPAETAPLTFTPHSRACPSHRLCRKRTAHRQISDKVAPDAPPSGGGARAPP